MNRKGMVAMMDAMIFVILIALFSVSILSFEPEDDDFEPLEAGEICEIVLSTDATDHGFIPDMGHTEYRMADALAYALMEKDEAVFDEVGSMIEKLTMGRYDYGFKVSIDGVSYTIGEMKGVPESFYSDIWKVIGGKDLFVEMQLD